KAVEKKNTERALLTKLQGHALGFEAEEGPDPPPHPPKDKNQEDDDQQGYSPMGPIGFELMGIESGKDREGVAQEGEVQKGITAVIVAENQEKPGQQSPQEPGFPGIRKEFRKSRHDFIVMRQGLPGEVLILGGVFGVISRILGGPQ